MNEIIEMERTGIDLIQWNTEDWVKNRKYIAVLKKDGCHWIESKKGEGLHQGLIQEETDKQIVFSFMDFIGFDFEETQGIFMVFKKEGRLTGLLLEHCNFYKNDKPPVIKDITNAIKQKLT